MWQLIYEGLQSIKSARQQGGNTKSSYSLVDTHTKCHCGYCNLNFPAWPTFLDRCSVGFLQPGMVRRSCDSSSGNSAGYHVCIFSFVDVDNSTAFFCFVCSFARFLLVTYSVRPLERHNNESNSWYKRPVGAEIDEDFRILECLSISKKNRMLGFI